MREVYWTVEWLSASQELYFMELLKAYRQWLQCCHLSSCFFFCANPTGCNIVLFKRGKWLISILFSSFCCKFWRYPQIVYWQWLDLVRLFWQTSLEEKYALMLISSFGHSYRFRHYPIIGTKMETLLFPPGFSCFHVTCGITLGNKITALFSHVMWCDVTCFYFNSVIIKPNYYLMMGCELVCSIVGIGGWWGETTVHQHLVLRRNFLPEKVGAGEKRSK